MNYFKNPDNGKVAESQLAPVNASVPSYFLNGESISESSIDTLINQEVGEVTVEYATQIPWVASNEAEYDNYIGSVIDESKRQAAANVLVTNNPTMSNPDRLILTQWVSTPVTLSAITDNVASGNGLYNVTALPNPSSLTTILNWLNDNMSSWDVSQGSFINLGVRG